MYVGAYIVSQANIASELTQWLKGCHCGIEVDWNNIAGRYVAIALKQKGKRNQNEIVAVGTSPKSVFDQATGSGIDLPLILHIPA